MPDSLGKQKGEDSPFFHMYKKEEMQKILFRERENLSFSTEEDLQKLSTFFHAEEQDSFLKKADAYARERQELTAKIQDKISLLVKEIFNLAYLVAKPVQNDLSLSKNCAFLAEKVENKEVNIRTNILLFLSNASISLNNINTFILVEKDLFLLETAYRTLGACPAEWENEKQFLLSSPPQKLAAAISQATGTYRSLEAYLASQLVLAAKAAKENKAVKYANLLHETAVHLFDAAKSLTSASSELFIECAYPSPSTK